MATRRWLGIDFSGNHLKWRLGCRTSNVWIAEVEGIRGLRVIDLRRVQAVPGQDPPFLRLARLLSDTAYESAGVDAPFSVPLAYLRPLGGHVELLRRIAAIDHPDRPFPRAVDLVKAVGCLRQDGKPLRCTERYWRDRGVNVRSAVWMKARGGPAMTAACLRLIHATRRPLWPWRDGQRGMVVEAFPAAQLRQWGLPHQRYNGDTAIARANRRRIVRDLGERVELGRFSKDATANADALDAVLCAFAAIAVSMEKLTNEPAEGFRHEGWIAVHR